MTHHNHHRHNEGDQRHAEIIIKRSFLVRALSLFAILLPVIFYILSMAFSLETIFNDEFALSYQTIDQDFVFNNTLAFKASPFFNCSSQVDESVANGTGVSITCDKLGKSARGTAGFLTCLNNNPLATRSCSLRVLAAELITAGTIMSGLAFGMALVAFAVGFSQAAASTTTITASGTQAESAGLITSVDEDSKGTAGASLSPRTTKSTMGGILSTLAPFTNVVAALFALVAGLLLVIGQAVAYTALVNDQFPLFAPDTNQGSQSYWFLGKAGQVYLTLAYCFAAAGLFTMVTKCGMRGR